MLYLDILWCFMALGCGESREGGESPIVPPINSVESKTFFLRFGDDLVGLWLGYQVSAGSVFSCYFVCRGIYNVYPNCSFFVSPMSPRHWMCCRWGDGSASLDQWRVRTFSHDLVSTYFNDVPPEMIKEIWVLDTYIQIQCQSHLDSKLLEDVSKWFPHLRHIRGRKKQLLNSIVVHQWMKTLLGLALIYEKVENYSVPSSL